MDASERFLRFAAECECMAKFTPSPQNEMVWRKMAERWLRMADVFERQTSLGDTACSMKRHRKPEHNWVH